MKSIADMPFSLNNVLTKINFLLFLITKCCLRFRTMGLFLIIHIAQMYACVLHLVRNNNQEQ